MIRITAKKDGFRRAGGQPRRERDYPDGCFTPEELAALKAEPMLVIEEIPSAGEAKVQPRNQAAKRRTRAMTYASYDDLVTRFGETKLAQLTCQAEPSEKSRTSPSSRRYLPTLRRRSTGTQRAAT